jgi:CheY-like chemotaxis protein
VADYKKTILIIEDDHATRVTLRQVLEHHDYFVVSAGNGAAGLEQLREMSRPHLIVLDILMPIMTGDEFLATVRQDSELSAIPVIQISASSTPRRAGVRCVISKPIDLKQLLAEIESAIAAAPTE